MKYITKRLPVFAWWWRTHATQGRFAAHLTCAYTEITRFSAEATDVDYSEIITIVPGRRS